MGVFRKLRMAISRAMPDRTVLAGHPALRPVAQHLLDPALWRMRHEAVARGVAVGLFWAFALPFAQVLAAAAHCVWWRANIPVAAAATFITNPFTLGFWLWLAYGTGRQVIDAPPPLRRSEGATLWEWMQSIGEPTLLGMAIFSVVGALLGYLLVKLGWRLRVLWRRRSRRAPNGRQPAPPIT